MKLTVTVLALALATAAFSAPAPFQKQPNPDATRIGQKIRRLDLLNQILPVLFTKEQLEKLLPIIEKSRQQEADLEAVELKTMKAIEAEVDLAIKEGLEKQKVPSDEIQAKLRKMSEAFQLGRMVLLGTNTAKVLEFMKKELNEGQRKAAANAFDPRIFDPSADPSAMSDDDKLKNWIQLILLDGLSYELLLDLRKART